MQWHGCSTLGVRQTQRMKSLEALPEGADCLEQRVENSMRKGVFENTGDLGRQ